MNKKVAIVSCFWVKNYGSVLQAYATQYKISKLGIDNETINYDCTLTGIDKLKFRLVCMRLKSMWIAKFESIKRKLIYRNRDLINNENVRKKCFDNFIQKNFILSHKYKDIRELKSKCNSYSTFIVGSDQLWLPLNVIIDYYTLNFVPDNINKIAYATSFGVSKTPKFLRKRYIHFIKRINYISVRELSGQKIVLDLINRNVPVVCDPTLMLNASDWLTIQKVEPIIKEKYIFCYFLGKNKKHRDFAKRFKDFLGVKIVALIHLDHYVASDETFADITPYDVDPGDFINLIRHAQYVLTDSFHGTIFSIINHKNFFVFNRFSSKQKYSTNSRIDSLLTITNLMDRRLEGDENPQTLTEKCINYTDVDTAIGKLRKTTDEFLKKSLYNGR